jgi:hypothetical protein
MASIAQPAGMFSLVKGERDVRLGTMKTYKVVSGYLVRLPQYIILQSLGVLRSIPPEGGTGHP